MAAKACRAVVSRRKACPKPTAATPVVTPMARERARREPCFDYGGWLVGWVLGGPLDGANGRKEGKQSQAARSKTRAFTFAS